MALTVLKRLPAEQMAAAALKEEILTGALQPGARLTETDLAEQFGVSRGTVRLALHQLSAEGLVSLVPYTGWSVVDWTPEDWWEVYTLRSGLEATAAMLAAERHDAAGAVRLQAVADELFSSASGTNVADIKRKDFAFHRCIVELSGNKRLMHHYQLVEQQVRIFIGSTYRPDKKRVVVEHHRPILQAILRREPRLAASLCESHCTSEGERVLGLLAGSGEP